MDMDVIPPGDAECTPHNKPQESKRSKLLKIDSHNPRIRVPATCVPRIIHLQNELGLSSSGAVLQWLLQMVRPEFIRPSENLPSTQPSQKNPTDESAYRSISFTHPEVRATANPATVIPCIGVGASKTTIRATVAQASTIFYDTPATIDKAERLIAIAAAYGSELVVFPEAFVGGYPHGLMLNVLTEAEVIERKNMECKKYHASAIHVPGPEVDRLAAIAGKYKVQLVMGVVEKLEVSLFSTVLFFDSHGQFLGKRRKVLPVTRECAVWNSGNEASIPVYGTPVGKIGALIGWDNRVPVLRTELYAKGIEIYCVPTAESREVWRASMVHTALEGNCFVLSANQFCRSKDYMFPLQGIKANSYKTVSSGGSVIVSPSGTILAGPNYQGESLISADLDFGEITRAKLEYGGVGHYAGLKFVQTEVSDELK